MAHYIDGFLFAVALSKAKDYQKIARRAGKIWIEYGALDYKECIGDDLNTEGMGSFTKTMATTKKETVFFSYIVYRNKKHRDAVNKKVMADPRIKRMMKDKNPPVDYSRMVWGGFKAVVDLQGKK